MSDAAFLVPEQNFQIHLCPFASLITCTCGSLLTSSLELQAVQHLAAIPGCDLIILSDANTIFISEILKHHNLEQYVRQVSQLRRYHPALQTCLAYHLLV